MDKNFVVKNGLTAGVGSNSIFLGQVSFSANVVYTSYIDLGASAIATTPANTSNSTAIATTNFVQTVFSPTNILSKLITVDGANSGLDADLLRGTTPSTFGLARLSDNSAANTLSALGLSYSSSANVQSGNGVSVVTPASVSAAMGWVTLTDATAIVVDHSAGTNKVVTITGNRTMSAPINAIPGWPLNIRIIQDTTGSRTITWDSAYDFGDGTAPTLSTGASNEDLISFICISSTKFVHVGTKKRTD